MTSLLPIVTSSPFSRHFEQSSHVNHRRDATNSRLRTLDTSSFETVLFHRTPRVSPISTVSIASTPMLRNDENFQPLKHIQDENHHVLGHQSALSKKLHLLTQQHASGQIRKISPCQTIPSADLENGLSGDELQARSLMERQTMAETDDVHGQTADGSTALPTVVDEEVAARPHKSINTQDLYSYSPVLSHRKSHKCTPPRDDRSFGRRHVSSPCAGLRAFAFHISHEQKHSDSSSGFVHTTRTASMSDGSFSILPRSLRFGRSSENQMVLNGGIRCSVDSDRPVTGLSIDEASMRRGIRRKQILEELISTEEGYLADLRALVYLYTTLLASTTNLSVRLRSSIQRNVTGLLQLHETLLEKLHQAELRAAARKWADTRIPSRLYSSRYQKWRKDERYDRKQQRARTSIESCDRGRAQVRIGTAEPDDIGDIARIFNETLVDLFAYEEYCANHEIIAHELQKRMPQLWSTYESGMESLARSITAIDRKDGSVRRGLTVGDLLIKPIQRICRYPLLLEDFLTQTPVADSPTTHAELEGLLLKFRDVIHAVNEATGSYPARVQIQRRWLLQDRLSFDKICLSPQDLRMLGTIHLCGVLHVTYQTPVKIDGCYSLCLLFNDHLLLAMPSVESGKFDVVALIHLSDLRIESASEGKGLLCPSALHTWKISFIVEDGIYELILSACSTIEEDQWTSGLQGGFRTCHGSHINDQLPSCFAIELKNAGTLFNSQKTLSRELSVQRAATVGNRGNVSQVILRNTHNAQDLHEFRKPHNTPIYRSQSHHTSKRIPVLEPRRSERVRMENSLADVWSREKLPFPGMIGSRGGQIIRASAGSLARKLSLASIHTSFNRRTASLTAASKKSYEALHDHKSIFEVRKESIDNFGPTRSIPHDIPEVDDMRSVVGRMIGGTSNGKRASFSGGDTSVRRCRSKREKSLPRTGVGPLDPAIVYYENSGAAGVVSTENPSLSENKEEEKEMIILEEGLIGGRRHRKRWSNPIAALKGFGTEVRNMLHSSNLW